VTLEQKFVLSFLREKVCSHVYVLPNTVDKFHAKLGNSENRDTGKEAEKIYVIKAS
jgi:hypothetical protein